MTNSMIPYSFIPGTKAKASEVNANFIALADKIDANKSICTEDISDINTTLSTKADKTELINEHTITSADTDLDDYTTKGTYIFSSLYTPVNIPKGTSGMLVVTGDTESTIKQIWYCDGENPEIYTRDYRNSTWGTWYSALGLSDIENPGYLKLPNGIIIQWGAETASEITYPLAYTTFACPVFCKDGWSESLTRSDTGISNQSLTGFDIGSLGLFHSMNWIVIGY